MLDEGAYRNQSELARGEGVSTAAVSIALMKLRRAEWAGDAPGANARQEAEKRVGSAVPRTMARAPTALNQVAVK